MKKLSRKEAIDKAKKENRVEIFALDDEEGEILYFTDEVSIEVKVLLGMLRKDKRGGVV